MRLRWAVIIGIPTLLLIGGLIHVQRTQDSQVGRGAEVLGLLRPDLGPHPDARCVGSAIRHAGVSVESRRLLSGSTTSASGSPLALLPPKDRRPWREAMAAARTGCPDPGFIPAKWRGFRIKITV